MNPVKRETLCSLLWNQISIAADGALRVCCNSYTPEIQNLGRAIRPTDFINIDYMFTPQLMDIRRKMLNGERPEICARCWNQEDTGQSSFRQMLNVQFPEALERVTRGDLRFKLEYLNLDFGNKCNLACKMCTPGSSSLIAKEHAQGEGHLADSEVQYAKYMLGKTKDTEWYENENFWTSLKPHYPDLKRLYLIGGEPFVIDAHLRLLEEVARYGNPGSVELHYSSNMTVLPKRATELWPKFKKVSINASIDGTGEHYEYIRWPARFTKVEQNVRELIAQKRDNLELCIHSTVQALNLVNLLDLVRTFEPLPVFFIPVHQPDYLHVGILPRDVIQRAFDEIEEFLRAQKMHQTTSMSLTSVLGFLRESLENYRENSSLRERFLKTMAWHDGRRKQNLLGVHPYFANYTVAERSTSRRAASARKDSIPV